MTQENVKQDDEINALRKEVQRLERLVNQPKACNLYEWLQEEKSKSEPKKFSLFTGLTKEQFDCLWDLLLPAANSLQFWGEQKEKKTRIVIPPRNQLLFTLIRLRQGGALDALSYEYGIEYQRARKIFITWIQFLYKKFNDIRSKFHK